MKLFAVLLSTYIFVTLAIDFFDNNPSSNNKEVDLDTVLFKIPIKLNSELLISEKQWGILKEQRSNKKKTLSTNEVFENNKNKLSIGGKEYLLYGIFSAESIPFILIKDDSTNFIKLKLGDVLDKVFSLVEINNNTIIFEQTNDQNNILIEFKLFERSTYANN